MAVASTEIDTVVAARYSGVHRIDAGRRAAHGIRVGPHAGRRAVFRIEETHAPYSGVFARQGDGGRIRIGIGGVTSIIDQQKRPAAVAVLLAGGDGGRPRSSTPAGTATGLSRRYCPAGR